MSIHWHTYSIQVVAFCLQEPNINYPFLVQLQFVIKKRKEVHTKFSIEQEAHKERKKARKQQDGYSQLSQQTIC